MPRVFMYGPDALQGRMFDRIGPTEFLGAAILDDVTLVFDKPNIKDAREGLPNLHPKDGAQTIGALFELQKQQFELLDGFFGGYEQAEARVRRVEDPESRSKATYWVARRTKKGLLPSAGSVRDALQALSENGVDDAATRVLLEDLQTLPEPEPRPEPTAVGDEESA